MKVEPEPSSFQIRKQRGRKHEIKRSMDSSKTQEKKKKLKRDNTTTVHVARDGTAQTTSGKSIFFFCEGDILKGRKDELQIHPGSVQRAS
jgi:hypothetical protein